MKLLVTNDDGPPHAATSPFISSFVQALQEQTEHDVHVVLPHSQRSWIGKAHFPGELITTMQYLPGKNARPWTLLNGSPACCCQIGISHLVPSVDVVIAGPNLGCNISSIFALSSGTVGAAFEGACLERRAIAVSYEIRKLRLEAAIAEANRLSVRIIQWLLENWDENVAMYNVNIPLRIGVEKQDVYWTRIMDNSWSANGVGGAYREKIVEYEAVHASDQGVLDNAVANGTEQLRSPTPSDSGLEMPMEMPRVFAWDPTYGDLWKDVKQEGSDAWAIHHGFPSITPLRANFAHVPDYAGKVNFSVVPQR